MFIGRLNEVIPVRYTLTKCGIRACPRLMEDGNPFKGEALRVPWQELIASGIDIHVSIPDGYLLNTVVIQLGEDSSPASLAVCSVDKKAVFFRHSGETGKPVSEKEVVLPVDEQLRDFVIEIVADFSDIAIHGIELYGADLSGITLFPAPDRITEFGGSRPADSIRSYTADCAQGLAAGAILAEKYREFSGHSLERGSQGDVLFVHDPEIPANGFILEVTEERVRICAGDLRGFVMGAETFVKLIRENRIPLCRVEDAPFAAFRGVHLYLPGPDQLAFARRLIKYVLSPNGYNYIILEMGAGMRFDSHPEINAAFQEAAEKTISGQWPPLPHYEVAGGKLLEKAQVRELVAYARSYGIEVIPEVQSLSHIQYLTLAHPDIAELSATETVEEMADSRLEDIPPSKFYAHSCCPSNPRTYEITLDILDEILEVVQPKEYVHMGHDEVYQIGICPVCGKEDPADLFARDVRRYYDHITARGLKMMIWADMLQPIGEAGKPKPTVNAVKLLPKDIVLMDFIWYFHPHKDIEDNLLPYGYSVIYGNMYSSHFPRFEKRIRKPGILGGQLSAWVGTGEEELAREGKLYDFIYTGQMLWSGDYCGYNRYAYDFLIKKQLPLLRCRLGDRMYPSMAEGACGTTVADMGDFDPDSVTKGIFQVGQKADSLVFYHAAAQAYRRLPWQEPETVASYRISYSDATQVSVPITYGGNICHWNRRQNAPLPNMFYRHNGYLAGWYCDGEESRLPDGRIACLYRYEWRNPYPEKVVTAVELIPEPDAQTRVIMNRITAFVKSK